jgi:hypothetical protein
VIRLALVLVLVSPATAAAQVIWAADFSAAQAPMYGFNDRKSGLPEGNYWSQTVRAAAGPSGQDAVEVSEVNGGDATALSFQHDLGWDRIGSTPAPAFGSTRFIRVLFKYVSPYHGSAQPDPVSGIFGSRWADKFVILGQGGTTNMRMMWNIRSEADPDVTIMRLERNIEGGDTRIDTTPFTLNQWYFLQWKIRCSSARDASDAQNFFYVDQTNEGTPTYSSGTYVWNCEDIGNTIGLGRFAGAADASTEVHFQIACFEYAASFATTCGTGGGGGSPVYRFRFRTALDAFVGFVAGLYGSAGPTRAGERAPAPWPLR